MEYKTPHEKFHFIYRICRKGIAILAIPFLILNLASGARFTNKELYNKLKYYGDKTNNFKQLSNNITEIIEEYGKDMVLIIDEVDKSSGNRIFMQFLGVLRNKYLAQNAKEDLTFR